jgi:hypothetical protein
MGINKKKIMLTSDLNQLFRKKHWKKIDPRKRFFGGLVFLEQMFSQIIFVAVHFFWDFFPVLKSAWDSGF